MNGDVVSGAFGWSEADEIVGGLAAEYGSASPVTDTLSDRFPRCGQRPPVRPGTRLPPAIRRR